MNITCSMSEREILINAHQLTAIPSLIIFYVLSMILFLGMGIFLIDREKSNYRKFLLIWIVSVILIGILVLFLIFSPNSVQWIANLVR